jgi:hypothetical protein
VIVMYGECVRDVLRMHGECGKMGRVCEKGDVLVVKAHHDAIVGMQLP